MNGIHSLAARLLTECRESQDNEGIPETLQRTIGNAFSFYCRELGQWSEAQMCVAGTVYSLGITIYDKKKPEQDRQWEDSKQTVRILDIYNPAKAR